MKKICVVLIIIFIIPFLTGCWDAIELEEEGYVAAIGLDKGAEKNVRVTFQVTNPKTISAGRGDGGGGGGQIKSEITSLDAPSIMSARDLISAATTRKLSLSHAKVIIVGEDFAKDKTFFRFVEASLREKEMRRITTLIISRERAEEFIRNNNPTLEDRMQKYYEFMARRWKDTGLVPPFANLNRFMQRTESRGSLFLAIYATTKKVVTKKGADEGAYYPGEIEKAGGNIAELIGASVLKDGRMIGKLNGNEMRLVSMLREEPETKQMLVTFIDPLDSKFRIDTRIIRSKKTKIKVDMNGDETSIDVTIPIQMDILGIPSFVNYPEDLDKQKFLKNYLERYLEKISTTLVEKTQKEFKGDPFQWDLNARKKFLTFDEYEKYNWMKHYTEANVSIHYDVSIRSFGKQLRPPVDPQEKQGGSENDSIEEEK